MKEETMTEITPRSRPYHHGDLRNGLVNNVVGWGSLVLVTAASATLLGAQVLNFVTTHGR